MSRWWPIPNSVAPMVYAAAWPKVAWATVRLSECMVRRRVASEKCSMAVGLRQCIRPSVESVTPGHDGCPLAFVLINWTAWKRPLAVSGFESVGETHCHLYFPPADLAGTFFLKQGL